MSFISKMQVRGSSIVQRCIQYNGVFQNSNFLQIHNLQRKAVRLSFQQKRAFIVQQTPSVKLKPTKSAIELENTNLVKWKSYVGELSKPFPQRTHLCGDISESNIGENVIVSGWVHSKRVLSSGDLIFFALRDSQGIIQLVYEESRRY
jgi:hypothetical protein